MVYRQDNPGTGGALRPEFIGKSDAYVAAYLEAERKLATGRTPAASHHHDAVARTNTEMYAAHEARMRKVYTDSFAQPGASTTRDHADSLEAPAGEESSEQFSARLARIARAQAGVE